MQFITDSVLVAAVLRQDMDVFDSHAVFRTIMRDWPQEYARDLYQCCDSPDPFVRLHTQLAIRLSKLPRVLTKVGEVQSMNCRGRVDTCASWARTARQNPDGQ